MMSEHRRIAWIDLYQLTRECAATALSSGNSPISVTPYANVDELVTAVDRSEVDLVVIHDEDPERQLRKQISDLRKAEFDQPVILVTQGNFADQDAAFRNFYFAGASGFLSTQSTSIEMAISSFAFACEGGIFAPLSLLLSEASEARSRQEADTAPVVKRRSGATRGRRNLKAGRV